MNSIKEKVLRNVSAKDELVEWYQKPDIQQFYKIDETFKHYSGKSVPVEDDIAFISLEKHLTESGVFRAEERIN